MESIFSSKYKLELNVDNGKTSFSTPERLAKRYTEPVIPETEEDIYVRLGFVSKVNVSKKSSVIL
jgi:hypothetical protein